MQYVLVRLVVLIVFMAATASCALAAQVRVVVSVPADTPPDAELYIAGSTPEASNWQADGRVLQRRADGKYESVIRLEAGQTLEFKITRGSWATVEKTSDGGERPNRVIKADDADAVVEIVVEGWSEGAEQPVRQSTVVGTLKLHELPSELAGGARTVRVWLPPGYDARQMYPVLYMHDGQNLFDAATSAFGVEWGVDETLTRLIEAGTVDPMIVVGIDNGGAARLSELTFVPDPEHGGGGGAAYEAFLIDTVMPFIGNTYNAKRVAPTIYIGGSSLGGLATLKIARRHPGMFDGAIVMSPSVWWADEALAAELEQSVKALLGVRVWLDIGAAEQSDAAGNQRLLDAVQRVSTVLETNGVVNRYVIDGVHLEHNEAAWAARFADAIKFITDGN